MPQKKSFGKKKFLNFMHGFKSAIWAEWKNCQNGTFEPVHEIQKLRAGHNQVLIVEFMWGVHSIRI